MLNFFKVILTEVLSGSIRMMVEMMDEKLGERVSQNNENMGF